MGDCTSPEKHYDTSLLKEVGEYSTNPRRSEDFGSEYTPGQKVSRAEQQAKPYMENPYPKNDHRSEKFDSNRGVVIKLSKHKF